jgi:DNA replication protein DnaC
MNDELKRKLKDLRLGGLLAHWDDYLTLAADQRFSHARLLTHVLEEEWRIKRENARQRRLKQAGIPEPLAIETYPFHKQPKLNKKKVMALYDSLSFMTNKENIIWLGRTGRGKTGLATSFLIQAINQGYTGKYVLFAELIGELYRSAADHSQAQVLKKYLAYDLVLIDEIGYVEVEPAQVGLFFTLMQKRHKTKPTLLTSNLGFSEWGSFLKNVHLTEALIDRLTETSHVFNMKECVGIRPRRGADELDSEPAADE